MSMRDLGSGAGRPGKDGMKRRAVFYVLAAVAVAVPLLAAGPAVADNATRTIVLKDHKFEPATIEVPAGVRVQLVIDNRDATPEEFDSHDLRREKVVPGHSKGTVWIGPLPKGEYNFVGEFHESTAKGKVIAK